MVKFKSVQIKDSVGDVSRFSDVSQYWVQNIIIDYAPLKWCHWKHFINYDLIELTVIVLIVID